MQTTNIFFAISMPQSLLEIFPLFLSSRSFSLHRLLPVHRQRWWPSDKWNIPKTSVHLLRSTGLLLKLQSLLSLASIMWSTRESLLGVIITEKWHFIVIAAPQPRRGTPASFRVKVICPLQSIYEVSSVRINLPVLLYSLNCKNRLSFARDSHLHLRYFIKLNQIHSRFNMALLLVSLRHNSSPHSLIKENEFINKLWHRCNLHGDGKK